MGGWSGNCGTLKVMPRPGIAPDTEIRQRDHTVPQYRVVLLDDNDHTYDYVIEMLQKLFYFSLDQAYQHAEEVDRSGRTVILTCELREAEFARDQIHGYGRDPRLARSKGSMSAVIEPAGSG
jgi:ATP-dependent Clp protease adaptor protein ClpS